MGNSASQATDMIHIADDALDTDISKVRIRKKRRKTVQEPSNVSKRPSRSSHTHAPRRFCILPNTRDTLKEF